MCENTKYAANALLSASAELQRGLRGADMSSQSTSAKYEKSSCVLGSPYKWIDYFLVKNIRDVNLNIHTIHDCINCSGFALIVKLMKELYIDTALGVCQ